MKHYIYMENIYYDIDLIELKVICSSDVIAVTSNIYVSDEIIDNLILQIENFLDGKVSECRWENKESDNTPIHSLSLRFIHQDKLGHISVEVFMEIEDLVDYNGHNCCFTVNTEIEQLVHFARRLPLLKNKQRGVKVILNQQEDDSDMLEYFFD